MRLKQLYNRIILIKAHLVSLYKTSLKSLALYQEIKNPDIEFRWDRFVDDLFLLLDMYQIMIQQKEAKYDF